MKRVWYLILAAALILAIGGCQNRPDIFDPGGGNSSMRTNPVNIADVTVDSAYLWIYVVIPTGQTVNVHAITSAWNENIVTWSSFAGAYNSAVVDSFVAHGIGWKMADITSLVQAWMDGDMPNLGLLLEQGESARTTYYSSEEISIAQRPRIEICYTVDGQQDCVTIQRGVSGHVFDAFIWGAFPNDNFGLSGNLFTGMLNEGQNQTLIQFDLPEVEEPGSVGDFVWNDVNMNGIQDAGELGLAGVAVHLENCRDSVVVAEALTDTMGYYLFEDIPAGSYFLHFVLPEGYVFSPMDQGDNDSLDSDVYQRAGHTDCFELGAGEVDMSWDAGMYAMENLGCTRGKGFWKNHAGFGPQDDLVSQYLPIWLGIPSDSSEALAVTTAQIAYDILTQQVYGTPSNGITKLYAHLLTARLNIASGADDGDIEEVLENVDMFLAAHSWEDWDALSGREQQGVLSWKGTLESYNEGEIGPGSCDDEDETPY
ncbi:MAG: hypothetical protein A2W25_06890 [candidate division Zixibacteria bacterium RBG_16_53_22]|nr:MAG: hypothetical protein A2W25_06890 [candidate division Zixibacteria bacterium RBG_16_53_22]